MQRMESRRVSFSLDISEKPMAPLRTAIEARPKAKTRGRCQEQISDEDRSNSSSSIRLFQYLRSNITRAIRLVSKKQQPLAKGSSNMVVPQQFVPHRDSHHSEALEDCIEFINSSCRKSI
ncbi:uncharacterized protein A4U43_C02F270 [Asparagus officinalis]|uniref:Josephin-like protein n=1 Tax=Asparagus officinalis TaxID=4686 RepID=A0A5P1FJS0_ASPOF|nr:uncharacterized protein A4U43_C02F270 [Asparagus officinalis]